MSDSLKPRVRKSPPRRRSPPRREPNITMREARIDAVYPILHSTSYSRSPGRSTSPLVGGEVLEELEAVQDLQQVYSYCHCLS